jgi:predicted NodU family carbamoyl transferase
MRILEVSAFYHDSAAVLLEDGRIVAAAQEERFTRKKYDARFPRRAIAYCLEEIVSTPEDAFRCDGHADRSTCDQELLPAQRGAGS